MADYTDVIASLLGGGLATPPGQGGSAFQLPPITGASQFALPSIGGAGGGFGLPAIGGAQSFELPSLGGGGSGFTLPSIGGGGAYAYPLAPVRNTVKDIEREQAAAEKAGTAGKAVTRGGRSGGPAPADVPAEWRPTLEAASAQYGVDPTLLAAQLKQENNFQASGTSPAGARGAAQFMPATAAQYGVDVNDPHSSIRGQAHYMSDLLRQYNGDQTLALVAYNGGDGAVQRWRAGRPYAESVEYVNKVQANQQAYRAQNTAASSTAVSAEAAVQANTGALRGVSQNTYAAQNGLPRDIAAAICGPAAVDAFARNMGRTPGPAEAFELARSQNLWDLNSGAHGPDSMVTLLGRLGVPARTAAPAADTVANEVQRGHMVIIDTPQHYYQVTGYNPATQQFQFGDAVGANRWATLAQLPTWGYGAARTAIVSTE